MLLSELCCKFIDSLLYWVQSVVGSWCEIWKRGLENMTVGYKPEDMCDNCPDLYISVSLLAWTVLNTLSMHRSTGKGNTNRSFSNAEIRNKMQ